MDLKSSLLTCVGLQPITRRRLKILGIITSACQPLGLKPVLVGGCAVEFYTFGGYPTFDIDVVVSNYDAFAKIMDALDFKKEGRHWTREDLDIAIEAPSSDLSKETAPLSAVEIDGFVAYVIGVEDLVIDRLSAAVHWQSKEDEKWARELIRATKNIDTGYLKQRSKETHTDELLDRILNK